VQADATIFNTIGCQLSATNRNRLITFLQSL